MSSCTRSIKWTHSWKHRFMGWMSGEREHMAQVSYISRLHSCQLITSWGQPARQWGGFTQHVLYRKRVQFADCSQWKLNIMYANHIKHEHFTTQNHKEENLIPEHTVIIKNTHLQSQWINTEIRSSLHSAWNPFIVWCSYSYEKVE